MTASEWVSLGSAVISLLSGLLGLIPVLLPILAKHSKKIGDEPLQAKTAPQIADALETIGEASPEVRLGYWIAVLAALCWSLGNIAFRWTAQRVPASTFEVAVVNYFVAGVMLLAWGAIVRRFEHSRQPIQFPSLPRFLAASFCKSINTYFWILAVGSIPAAAAAALENTHAVWAALPLVLLFGVRLPKIWIYGSVLVLVGAALVTRVAVHGFAGISSVGFAAALLSGFAFAGFYVLWAGKGDRPPARSQRAIEMGSVVSVACILLFPIHVLVSSLWPAEAPVFFGVLPRLDLLVQAINGLVGIGLTYLLVGEALHRMRSLGSTSSFLLGFAMSAAVPLTMLLEFVTLKAPIEPFQWVGAAMFSFGFIFVAGEIDDALRHQPLPSRAMPSA